ncbi:MAG: MFS transporter [Leucobacter sp.]
MTKRRLILPWGVWGVSALAYALAVINRSSLAALGPAAQDHFGIDATTLSMFAVIQLIVYAGLQIPVGTLLDRFGATTMILVGGLLMVVGQATMATVADVWLAILARVLVGAGDACTFISVMRLLPEWFSVRQLPMMSQLTGLIGQGGQLVSVTPLALVVGGSGWVTGFVGVAAVSLLAVVLGCFVLRNEPGAPTTVERLTGRTGRISRRARSLGADDVTGAFMMPPPATSLVDIAPPSEESTASFWHKLRVLLSIPGVRLAYWLHFTSPFAVNVFVLLWGTPFLTGGVGLDSGTSRTLLNILIVSSMAAGLLLGPLSSRFLERRVWFNVGITIAIMAVWIAVLVWPGGPPIWLLVLLVIVIPLGGPASMIAFEVARSHTPRSYAGFGTGFVNTAGFTSSLLVVWLIGLVLDLEGVGSPELYTLDAFRVAFAVQIPFWVFGIVMILVERRRTWNWMGEHGRKLR